MPVRRPWVGEDMAPDATGTAVPACQTRAMADDRDLDLDQILA